MKRYLGDGVYVEWSMLYHERCKPGTISAIHGDVAIVNDEDFA